MAGSAAGQAVAVQAIEAAVMEVAIAIGTEIAGELGAKCAVAAALEVGKAAGARAAGN